jgi:radical SAM superfamily enzyme YgiQ (UPF0313 family)
MKFSFVFPPFYLESLYNLPPLGLMNLATGVQGLGCKADLHDFVLEIRRNPRIMNRFLYEHCVEKILAGGPDVVAFSAQCTTYPPVTQIAQKIKEREPGIKILVGGHNASFVDVKTLTQFPWIDAVVRGEGEETIGALAERYVAGRDEEGVLGVTWRKGGEVYRNPDRPLMDDLNRLPMPDYGLVAPLSEYRDACGLPRSIAILEVGRGCPHQCVYCSESVLWRRRTRTFSVDRLVKEMRTLHEERGAECFLLAYDQFTANRAFVESFCQKVLAEGLQHLPWYCISRLDTVDADSLHLMRSAGCESMCYGIDSGSRRTLAFIGKQIDERILYRRVRETTAEGMIPTLSFVVGFPEEEKEDIDATLMLALKTGIQGNSNPLIQMPTVLPGTRLYEGYLRTLVRRVDTYFSLGIEFDNGIRFSADEKLIDDSPDIFSSFYNLPSRTLPLTALHRIASYFPLVVNFYPKSFLLLGLALKRSVSDLFFEWLAWANEKESRSESLLTPADCYSHFNGFALHAIEAGRITGWDHLPQVVHYETRAIEVAKHPQVPATATADICGVRGMVPIVKKNNLVAAFTKSMPAIVADLKAGIFSERYPDAPGWLVFHQEKNELNVMEINDFGKDFLDLCDGESSLERIAETLYPRYAAELSTEAFFEACRQTAEELSEFKLLGKFAPLAR